jgi:hypothetical protein
MKLWNDIRINRADIPSYWTQYYYSALRIFYRYKRFGLPFSGGWAQQPAYLIDMLELFDSIQDSHERHEMNKEKQKHGSR